MHRTNTEFKNRYIHSIIQAQIFSSLNELSFRSTFSIKKKKKKKTDETFAPLLNVDHLKTKKKTLYIHLHHLINIVSAIPPLESDKTHAPPHTRNKNNSATHCFANYFIDYLITRSSAALRIFPLPLIHPTREFH